MPDKDQRSAEKNTANSAAPDPLCVLCKIPPEEVLAEFQRWKLVRTKTMKGHRERLMLLHKNHVQTLDEGSVGEAYLLMMGAGSKFFSYTDKWAIFEPVYATVPDHWHRVLSDLDKSAQDYNQILKTPRIIIDNHDGTIFRVFPDKTSPESKQDLAKSSKRSA